jgi:glycosyltransferase involved in cell wall biosynthesis
MKIALVCDWLVTYAGSERFLGEMIQCFPDADVFAVVDFLPAADRHFLNNKPVKTTFIQKLPYAKKFYRNYLPLMPLAIEQLDVSQYDLIISSSHAVSKGVITGPDQVHISYIHSPMRYAWDLQHQYLKESGLENGLKAYAVKYFLHKLRVWDQRTANGVDHFVANSHFIARRIWKTYRREASVIYPPLNHAIFKPHMPKENFYLAASRLVPYKKMDLIVDSFAHMPDKKLVVIGSGPDFEKVKARATSNVEVLGFQPDKILVDYMQRARALVFAAEEDFGLVPLEAQACGTPVIAFGKGGALETVRGLDQENPTGVFFGEQSVQSICSAVQKFEEHGGKITAESCIENAAQFSPEQFREKFKQYVQKCTPQFQPV